MFLLLSFLLGSAQAEPVPQLSAKATGSHALTGPWSANAQAIVFWSPGAEGDGMLLTYAGLSLQPTKGWQIAVKPGLLANWLGEGDVSPVLAMTNAIHDDEFKLDVFIDTEVYFTPDSAVYYGYYSVSRSVVDKVLSLGVQVEHVNFRKGYSAGPQLNISFGEHLNFGFEYYVNVLVVRDQAMRANVNFFFGS